MAGRGNPVTLKVESIGLCTLKIKCASNRYYAVVKKDASTKSGLKVYLRSDNPKTIVEFVRRSATSSHVFDLETGTRIWSGLPRGHIRLLPLLNRWHQAKGR